jgi:hypothetical protein
MGIGVRRFGDMGERECCWEVFSLRGLGFMESPLLWSAELQYGFIVDVAHPVSRDRRHKRIVDLRVRDLYQ